MRVPLNRQSVAALLLALAAAGWLAVAQLREELALNRRARVVQGQIGALQVSLLDVEKGQRGVC